MLTLFRTPKAKSQRTAKRKPYLGASAGEQRVLDYLQKRRDEYERKLRRKTPRFHTVSFTTHN